MTPSLPRPRAFSIVKKKMSHLATCNTHSCVSARPGMSLLDMAPPVQSFPSILFRSLPHAKPRQRRESHSRSSVGFVGTLVFPHFFRGSDPLELYHICSCQAGRSSHSPTPPSPLRNQVSHQRLTASTAAHPSSSSSSSSRSFAFSRSAPGLPSMVAKNQNPPATQAAVAMAEA